MIPFSDAAKASALQLIDLAFTEDLGTNGDLTANAVIPAEAHGSATIAARKPGALAGLPVVALIAERMNLSFDPLREDGMPLTSGMAVARVSGSMRSLLIFERTALNFLQHLSGIASLTAKYVHEVSGTPSQIYDTRKTLPGWRLLEKYAVVCGGGRNHRIGLFDAVLIKDNHLAWLEHEGDPIGTAVSRARATSPSGTVVEVEVDTWEQFERALTCGPDIILVDNFDVKLLHEAVARRNAVAPKIELESSGGITLDTLRARAETGVDRISVGSLTHSAPALDIGLDFEQVMP